MSEFRAYIRSQLARWDPRWAEEWDQAIGDGQTAAALGRIKKLGGDPDFCLYVLADYRWRTLRPLRDLRHRDELLRAINALLRGRDLWASVLRRGSPGLSSEAMQDFLFEARLQLQAARALDEATGINHTYLFVELHYANITGFGAPNKMNLSDLTLNAGISFEF